MTYIYRFTSKFIVYLPVLIRAVIEKLFYIFMKQKYLPILSVIAIVLLVFSQVVWVRQLIERDKQRFRMELDQTLQNVVAFSLSKAIGNTGGSSEQNIELIPLDPSKIPEGAVIKGSFDTKEYQSGKNLGNFLVGVFAEDLLQENKVPLEPIDSLFRKEFPHYTEIEAYSMSIRHTDSLMRELHVGEKALAVIKDTTSGVRVNIPIGKSGAYSYNANVVFKPTVFTQRMLSVTVLSAAAVVLISLLLLYQLIQLRRKTNELEAHKKAVRGIVHDLKSPLAYVYTMLGIFEKTEAAAEKKNMLSTSKTRVKYLSDKIDVLLSAFKQKDYTFQIHLQPYEFTTRCREIMEELSVIHIGKHIGFSIEPPTNVLLMVDPAYFDGCVRNLLDNAVKYAPDDPFITVTAALDDKQTVLSFTDNGRGMDKKEQKKVFREFYRTEPSSTIKNHGVGLAFVKQVVRAHGGKITLQSTPGKGSVFTIYLPEKAIL